MVSMTYTSLFLVTLSPLSLARCFRDISSHNITNITVSSHIHSEIRKEQLEARIALLPLLQAESDRRYARFFIMNSIQHLVNKAAKFDQRQTTSLIIKPSESLSDLF